jgi:proline dehydrogenase
MATLFDRMVVGLLPVVPKPIVGYFSRPYIAGSKVEDAIRIVRDLASKGAMSTLDILGEHIRQPSEADAALAGYLSLLDTVDTQKVGGNVSIKPTMLGMKLDLDECANRIDRLVARAHEKGIFVRIDMEDSSCTDDTIAMYKSLRAKYPNVGVVIQAMLRRTLADVQDLASMKANIRLCKGIYVEPRTIAYQERDTIRRSFVASLDILLAGGCYVGIATHDEHLVFEALRLIQRHRLSPEQYEFQMLLGVDEELRRIIISGGHRLRVYVPFGEKWYAYSVRRFKENPHMAGTITRAVFGLK